MILNITMLLFNLLLSVTIGSYFVKGARQIKRTNSPNLNENYYTDYDIKRYC